MCSTDVTGMADNVNLDQTAPDGSAMTAQNCLLLYLESLLYNLALCDHEP